MSNIVVGVDGWKRGWVAIRLSGDRIEAMVFATFADLMAAQRDAGIIAVDMPIGLVETGTREADVSARGLLGPRRSSVFPTPARSMLPVTTYAELQRRCREAQRPGMSSQAFALFPKIREVDAFATDPRVFEVHPEVSFAALAGAPLAHGKKTWAGMHARLALLASAGLPLPTDLGPANIVPPDDVIDATVAAWTARRIATGTARAFPEQPTQHDAAGRRIAIWA